MEELYSKMIAAREYLKNTDWYYARKIETGEEVPADIVTKRTESREIIRNYEQNI